MTHICVGNRTIIGSDDRRQAIAMLSRPQCVKPQYVLSYYFIYQMYLLIIYRIVNAYSRSTFHRLQLYSVLAPIILTTISDCSDMFFRVPHFRLRKHANQLIGTEVFWNIPKCTFASVFFIGIKWCKLFPGSVYLDLFGNHTLSSARVKHPPRVGETKHTLSKRTML